MPDGSRWIYVDSGTGTFTPPPGRHDTFVKNGDGTFDLTLQRSRTKFHFGSDGSLLTLTDEFGNAHNYTYDGNGRLSQVTDAAGSGRSLTLGWGADGRISSVTDNSGRHVQYGYNAQGALITVTDVGNRIESLGYATGRFGPVLNQVTNQGTGSWNLPVTSITYDSTYRVQSYTSRGETYTYTYAFNGNPLLVKKADSTGAYWLYTYLANGLITDRTPPAGGGGNTHTDFYPDNSVMQYTDGVGVKSYVTWDAQGNVAQFTKDYQGPLAVRYDYAYDPSFPGKVTSITPTNPSTGQVDTGWQGWRYDYYQTAPAAGAPFHVYRVHDDGTTLDTLRTYVYNGHGQVTRSTDATGAVTDYTYDASGNLWKVTGPANNDAGTRPVTTNGYDSVGRVTSVTDALNHATTYTYDNLDRVTSVTLPKPSSGSTLTFATTYTYDNFDAPSGLVFTNTTDSNGLLSKQGYDQYGQLVKSIDTQSGVTAYAYTRGLLTGVTDANNNTRTYTYDGSGRLTFVTNPLGYQIHYGYNDDNTLQSQSDRAGSNTYDHLKRLVVYQRPSDSTSYTFVGQSLTQVIDTRTNPDDVTLLDYDGSYRLSSVTQGSRGTINYLYDAADRQQSYSVQSGPSASYSFYADGSLNSIVWSPVSGNFKYQYTLNGRKQTITFPNNATRNYSYDDQGRLLTLSNATAAAANLATYVYGYDFDYTNSTTDRKGQRASMMATVPAQGLNNHLFKYEYDTLYQLKRATYPNVAPFSGEVDSWSYDGIGNRLTSAVNGTTATYTYQTVGANPLNWQRLLNDGTTVYTYDPLGNVITKGAYSLGWDDGKLLSISSMSNYEYDYQGRRIGKTVGAVSNTFLYDRLNLIQEQGSTAADYLFGPGIDEPLAMSRGGQTYYYVVDGLGSVTEVTNAAGTVQNTYFYDAWGQTRSQTGTLANPFGYTAREFGEAGTLFYRARYNQVSIGRFLSEDPLSVSFDRGPLMFHDDVYAFPWNNPLYFRDPLGLYGHCNNYGDPKATCGSKCAATFQLQMCGLEELAEAHKADSSLNAAFEVAWNGGATVKTCLFFAQKPFESELAFLIRQAAAEILIIYSGCLRGCEACHQPGEPPCPAARAPVN